MTTLSNPVGFVKSYANARKLFQLNDLPVGVMTHGLGNIGSRSIEGTVLEYCKQIGTNTAIADLAEGLYQYVRPLYDAQYPNPDPQQHGLGFVIAGYSPSETMADEFEFVLPLDTGTRRINPHDDVGASWRGIAVAVTAIVKGMNPAIRQELITSKNIPAADVDALSNQHGMVVVLDGMPVQDAVEFATYILDTTIGWAKFQVGVASCARPLQMAVVRPNTGWEWLAQPRLYVPYTEETP
jgi:hypothetical protein